MYDVVVIGGGINGCGCAADATARGLSVLLCEQDDFASQTSSKSSKLIHGGLRYLEQYNLCMVKKALDEQAILMQIAPHLVHPLAFMLPNQTTLRPAWLLRMGLLLYDHLSRSNPLPHSRRLRQTHYPEYFQALHNDIESGFLFYDCQTDDARLTLSLALQAKAQGATLHTRTKLINATAKGKHWVLTLQPQSGDPLQITAKAVINAAGPWVNPVAQAFQRSFTQSLVYVRGSHIVVPALYHGHHAYLLQASDKRVVFVLPYHGYSLIGTTEISVSDPTEASGITAKEIDYFKTIVRTYFKQSLPQPIATWSGIRTLCAAPGKSITQLSRDYVLDYASDPAPLVSVLSGKLTTYRRLAAEAIDTLQAVFPHMPPSSTKTVILPGGDWQSQGLDAYIAYAQQQYAWLDTPILNHYLSTYGSRSEKILQDCKHQQDLGLRFGPLLYEKEIAYLKQEEWAQTAEDILWRRTKLGLSINIADRERLETYLGVNPHLDNA
ncbi:MAG: glycerol-3-phosphate dehydrogenase [Gammaproteobacteria bacterium]|nr:glycerol-3-phosphate dehydrogenase [Gammaproteobacteria bacterium]